MLEEGKPQPFEFRSLPSVGIFGTVSCLQAVQANPALWQTPKFWGAFLVTLAMTAYGSFWFFKHWGLRMAAPLAVVAVYILVAFSVGPVVVLIGLVLTFGLVTYFVSPERGSPPVTSSNSRHEAITSRRAAEMERDNTSKETEQSAKKWDAISDLISDYRRVRNISISVNRYLNEMQLAKRAGGQTANEIIENWINSTTVDNAKFAEIRPDVVRLVTDMMSKHGFSDPRLSVLLTYGELYATKTVSDMVTALDLWSDKLSKMITDRAAGLI